MRPLPTSPVIVPPIVPKASGSLGAPSDAFESAPASSEISVHDAPTQSRNSRSDTPASAAQPARSDTERTAARRTEPRIALRRAGYPVRIVVPPDKRASEAHEQIYSVNGLR